jgi:hypothetical protein
MVDLIKSPLFVFALSFVVMFLSELLGTFFRRRWQKADEGAHQDLDVIVTASLTLLGLIIGFSFSMAVGRYDQRKNCEEAEANAIGTEYLRLDFLPVVDATRARALLQMYLDKRILFYETQDERQLGGINAVSAQLQAELWSAVHTSAAGQPTPVIALTVSGLNDVFNSQGYTQAAFWNRIPIAAWILMAAMAICCNLLLVYARRCVHHRTLSVLVLPLVLSIAFFLIADIDSPRRGVIRVHPENLIGLAASLHEH